jgi:hypothetical protein
MLDWQSAGEEGVFPVGVQRDNCTVSPNAPFRNPTNRLEEGRKSCGQI